jgi:tight adherence protein B
MNPWLVSLLVFLFATTTVAAAGAFWLNLRWARDAAERAAAARPTRLQRLPRRDETQPSNPVSAFDRWFLHLLRDAGIEWNPNLAALLLSLWSIAWGAALFVYDERLGPAAIAALVALPLPLIVLSIQRARRVARLEDQMPPALEILARSMRAGQSLDQAIKVLGQHSPDPLAKEFRWCAQQLEMGLSLPAVMRSLSERVRLYDVRILATTLIVHRQAGGNVVQVLERLAQVIRERLNYRRQMRATTAAGRMSAGLVATVAPGVLVYFFFFQTDYLQAMLRSSVGVSVLVTAVVLEIVGLVWIARLTRPAY